MIAKDSNPLVNNKPPSRFSQKMSDHAQAASRLEHGKGKIKKHNSTVQGHAAHEDVWDAEHKKPPGEATPSRGCCSTLRHYIGYYLIYNPKVCSG